MALIVSHAFVSLLFTAIGLGAGWWLCIRTAARHGDSHKARDVLTSLHGLTRRVAADVGEHNSRVGQVDKRLAAQPDSRAGHVHRLVDELMKANQDVQQKLAETEGRLEELSQQIEYHASEARTDELTGLANRRAFQEELSRQLLDFRETDRQFSLIIFDVDHFKEFNDAHGHVCGDEVLRIVGRVLTDNMRGRDMVTRFGGEEFAVLMPATGVQEACRCSEVARAAVEANRVEIDGKSLGVTVSAGVAQVFASEDAPLLIKRADQAMYAAKNAGRNQTFWHDGTLAHSVDRLERGDEGGRGGPATQNVLPTTNTNRGHRSFDSESEPLPSAKVDLDFLANIGNKTMFCQAVRRRIAEWKRGGTTFAALLLSIDGFRELGSQHGQSAADMALGTLAQAIRERLRDMDLVARYSDATFGLVLPEAKLRDAVLVGERLRKTILKTGVLVDGRKISFTVSLGIVEVTDGDEMATLVERARAELGRASSGGGNRSGFTNSA